MRLKTELFLFLVVYFYICVVSGISKDNVVVEVSNGILKGFLSEDETLVEFHGVSYASLAGRFQAPGPEPKWDGVYEANKDIWCTQPLMPWIDSNTEIVGQDDCHILNVYVPTKFEAPLPVMIIFPGGGFFFGGASRSLYGPEFLTAKGVILVAIQYRLGIEGFLCLGTKEAPGNAGMKDQVAALRWVKRNIKAFGGDPDNITIFGISAGGVAVDFQMISPMSKGLFNKAIIMSGSSLSEFALTRDPVEIASLFAKSYSFESKDPKELYNFFLSKSSKEFAINFLFQMPLGEHQISTRRKYIGLCVEKEFDGVEPFLTEDPIDILIRGDYSKVPVIIGTLYDEGIFMLTVERNASEFKLEDSLPEDLEFPTIEIKREVAKRLQQLYLNGEDISQENFLKLSRLYGDPGITYPCLAETELLLKTNDKPVYSYLFTYEDKILKEKRIEDPKLRELKGPTHADDQFYLFKIHIEANKTMTDIFTTLWTNFAKYGDPTPQETDLIPVRWQPSNVEDPQSFVIDLEFSTEPLFYEESLKVWDEIYKKYGKRYKKLRKEVHSEL